MQAHVTPGSIPVINSPMSCGCASLNVLLSASVLSLCHTHTGTWPHTQFCTQTNLQTAFPLFSLSFDNPSILSPLAAQKPVRVHLTFHNSSLSTIYSLGSQIHAFCSTSILTFLQVLCLPATHSPNVILWGVA